MENKKIDVLYKSADETSVRLQRRPSPSVTLLDGSISASFEFFPPKGEKAAQSLWDSVQRLTPLQPDFVSVTYGAGGTTRERTYATVKRLVEETPLAPAAHLTCVDASCDEINEVVDSFWDAGIRHIVALRGDPPSGAARFKPHPQGYRNAAALVEGIKKRHDFEISVAAYPEVHPDAASAQSDLDNLKRKVDAGANRAITQFFFDADTYLRFCDRARDAGIDVPIVPGILPVTNFARVQEFAAQCGASVPAWMEGLFADLDHAPDIRQLVSATVTAELCTRLVDQGVQQFHFYTLNRFELTFAICHILGLRARMEAMPAEVVNG